MTKRIGTGELSVVSRMMAARAREESRQQQPAGNEDAAASGARTAARRRLGAPALPPARAAQGERLMEAQGERLRASGLGRAAWGEGRASGGVREQSPSRSL